MEAYIGVSAVRGQNSEKKTKAPMKVFLLGSGIKSSPSPQIQNRAFSIANINAKYFLLDVDKSNFRSSISNIKTSSNHILGFNVTVPYKEMIIPYIDVMDKQAEEIGAVNAVKVVTDGLFYGFNTDVHGTIASLSKLGLKGSKRKNGVVLGAGGAARACVYALALIGFDSISILNRTLSRGLSIVDEYEKRFPGTELRASKLEEEKLTRLMRSCNCLINCISRSSPRYFPIRLDFGKANKEMKVLDLGYKNPPSLFFQKAKSLGLQTIDGISMLVEQAARSFEIWTDLDAPRRQMTLVAKTRNEARERNKEI